MDNTDYDLALADAAQLDEMDQNEDVSFGKEVAKTLVITTVTSAAVFGGMVAIPYAAAHVKRWFSRKKNPDIIDGEVISDTIEPTTEKV